MADGVNILHVTPGFAGQKAVEGTVEKTGTVIERIKSLGLHDYIIEVDGNITFERAKILRDLGRQICLLQVHQVYLRVTFLTIEITSVN